MKNTKVFLSSKNKLEFVHWEILHIRCREKNLNLNRDANLGTPEVRGSNPGSDSIFFSLQI